MSSNQPFMDWKYGLPAFAILGVFIWYWLSEQKKYLSDKENVRYTLTRIHELRPVDGFRHVHGYFYYKGQQYHSTLIGSGSMKNCSRGIKVGDYLWVKFSTVKPKWNEVLSPCEYKTLNDSIPIPEGGITEEMLDFYAK